MRSGSYNKSLRRCSIPHGLPVRQPFHNPAWMFFLLSMIPLKCLWDARKPTAQLFICICCPQQRLFCKLCTNHLLANRQTASVFPHGTLIAGKPAMFTGTVQTSPLYIFKGIIERRTNIHAGLCNGCRIGRGDDNITLLECGCKFLCNLPLHQLCFLIISIIETRTNIHAGL